MSDELKEFDLSAWEVPAPRAGLADAVIARMRAPATAAAIEPVARASRRWWIGAVLAAAAAAIVFVIARGGGHGTPDFGAVATARARTLQLDGLAGELDPGAVVAWRREGDELVIAQPVGSATWRVGGGEIVRIDAVEASIEATGDATGASLRVEVHMNFADARLIGASALTAATVAFATVVVYEGHVKVSSGGQTVTVQPGATVELKRGELPAPPPLVGANEERIRQLEQQLQQLRDRVEHAGGGVTVSVPSDVAANETELERLRPRLAACVTKLGWGGTFMISFQVRSDGAMDGSTFQLTAGPAGGTGDADKLVDCLRAATAHGKFEPRPTPYKLTERLVVDAPIGYDFTPPARCQPVDHFNPFDDSCDGKPCPVCKPPSRPKPPGELDALDRYLISEAMEVAKPEVERCGVAHPASGIVKVHVKVGGDGGVTQVDVTSTPDAALGKCVADVMQKTTFQPTKNGGAFSYPFVFSAPATSTAACDPEGLKQKGLDHEAQGMHAVALHEFEASLTCKSDMRVIQYAFMAACNTGNKGKAKQYYWMMSADARDRFVQMCIRRGITKDDMGDGS